MALLLFGMHLLVQEEKEVRIGMRRSGLTSDICYQMLGGEE
jgi:hypothetical protein